MAEWQAVLLGFVLSSRLGLFRLSVVLTAVTERLGTVRGLTDYSGWLASEPVARGLSGGKSEFSRHPIAPWRTPSSCLFGMQRPDGSRALQNPQPLRIRPSSE